MTAGASTFDRIQATLAALPVAVAMAVTPTSTALSEVYAAPAWWSESPATTSHAGVGASRVRFDPVLEQQWCRDARAEIAIAHRVLGALRGDDAAEVLAYLGAVDAVLHGLSEELWPHELPGFADGLRAARVQLERSAATYGRWRQVARAVDDAPDAWLTVPARFVVRDDAAAAPEPVFVVRASERRARRIAEAFWGQYADPPAT